jgi:hypothetical protein
MCRKCNIRLKYEKFIHSFIQNLEVNRPLPRPSRRRKDNIEIDIRELWYVDVDWIHMVRSNVHENEVLCSIKYVEIFD